MKEEALAALGKTKEAIKALDLYLKEKANSTDADVLIRRAALKAQIGDKAGAKADYQTALKYLPNDPTALAGLKQIGAAK